MRDLGAAQRGRQRDVAPGERLAHAHDVGAHAGVVGAAGQSTWRYQVYQTGEGRLLMHYRRPWEVEVAPAKTVDCQISVR